MQSRQESKKSQSLFRIKDKYRRIHERNNPRNIVCNFGSNLWIVSYDASFLTSAHGVLKGCDGLMVFHFEENQPCTKMVIINRDADYAIFEIKAMETRKAIKIPKALANWKKSYNLLDKTYYTGYPNSIGPTTWTGNISGFTGDYLIVQTYAWSGASGSGVFDERGELIGIVMALDVGANEYGYQVLNNFVIVVPTWQIDFGSLLE